MSGLIRWFDSVDREGLDRWIATRPKVVRHLLTQYPIGSLVAYGSWVVIGATEIDQLIVAPADSESYDHAMERRQYLCGKHLRAGEVHWEKPK